MDYKETNFAGKKAIEIKTSFFRMIVITESGPRIAFFGKLNGENLFFWDDKNYSRGEWKLMGGHRIWATRPGADESEDAYRPDNFPCEIQNNRDSLTILGNNDQIFNTRRGINLKIENDNRVLVDNFVINTGDMLYSAGVWSLTCTNPKPSRKYGIPIGNGSEWDCFRFIIFRKWAGGHRCSVNDPQITFTEDMLLINPKGIETKRMIESHSGIIAMDAPDQQTTFIKKVTYQPNANYPMGCNLAFYIGQENFMVEMETMGSEITLKPKDSVHSIETWVLTKKALGLDNSEKLLKIF